MNPEFSHLEVLEEVSEGQPEAAVVEGLRVELALDSGREIGPPGVVRIPGTRPGDGFAAGAILDSDDLATAAEICNLCDSVKEIF